MTKKEFKIQRALGTVSLVSKILPPDETNRILLLINVYGPKALQDQIRDILNPLGTDGNEGLISNLLMDWIEEQLND